MKNATPIKLKSGDWGAKVNGIPAEGDAITITTKSGKSWEATVSKVVWHKGDVAICVTQKRSRRQRMGSGHGIASPVRGYSSYCTDNDSCMCFDCS